MVFRAGRPHRFDGNWLLITGCVLRTRPLCAMCACFLCKNVGHKMRTCLITIISNALSSFPQRVWINKCIKDFVYLFCRWRVREKGKKPHISSKCRHSLYVLVSRIDRIAKNVRRELILVLRRQRFLDRQLMNFSLNLQLCSVCLCVCTRRPLPLRWPHLIRTASRNILLSRWFDQISIIGGAAIGIAGMPINTQYT